MKLRNGAPLVCYEWVAARVHHAKAKAHVESHTPNRRRRAVGPSYIGRDGLADKTVLAKFDRKRRPPGFRLRILLVTGVGERFQQDTIPSPTPYEIIHSTPQLNECLGPQLCLADSTPWPDNPESQGEGPKTQYPANTQD